MYRLLRKKAVMAARKSHSFLKLFIMLAAATAVSCSTMKKSEQFILTKKKSLPSMDYGGHKVTMLIFTNSKGEKHVTRVFVDTFDIGGCYVIKR